MSEYLAKLKKDHRFFTMGKNPKVLLACCEYIQGLVSNNWIPQKVLAEKHGITSVSIRNHYKEIMLRLGMKPEDYSSTTRRNCATCYYYRLFVTQTKSTQEKKE